MKTENKLVHDLTANILSKKLANAALNGDANAICSSLAAGADVNLPHPRKGFYPIFGAVSAGSLECVTLLIAAGADVNQTNIGGAKGDVTLCGMAAVAGRADILAVLIQAGADVNLKAGHGAGIAPLLAAIDAGSKMDGHVECIRMLLKAGANVNETDGNGDYLTMIYAVANGNLEVVLLLIAAGGCVNAKYHNRSTLGGASKKFAGALIAAGAV